MSNLNEFTIEYKIQVNAALSQLGKLNNETTKTNKALTASAKGASQFSDAITNSLSGAMPVLGRVSSALKAITSEFGVMTAGATAAGAALYNAMRVRAQFNEQRVQSRDAGMAAVRLEDLQRRTASGNVSRDMVARAVTGSQSFLRGAYADPSRLGPANRLLGMLGINPASGGAPVTNTEFLTRLATRWHGQNDSTVEAEAQMVGMDKDVALKFKELGASISDIAMSLDEMKQYMDIAGNVHKLNDEMAKFNEQVTQLGETLGGPVITHLTEVVKKLNEYTDNIAHPSHAAARINANLDERSRQLLAGMGRGSATTNEAARDLWKAQEHQSNAQIEAFNEEQRKKQELLTKEEQPAADFQAGVSQMELAINAFGASVNQFGHTISEQQVRAAWAGVTGLAGGISTSGHKQLGYGETPGSINFDPKAANAVYNASTSSAARNNPGNIRDSRFARQHGATGARNGFAVFPDMATGEAAMDALLAAYRKGGRNTISSIVSRWAPSSENNTSAYIAAVSKAVGKGPNETLTDADMSAVKAAMKVQEGTSRSGGANLTGPQAVAMDPNYKGPFRFSGPTNLASGKGESFESLQLADLQKTIAARAGVSLYQLQNRGAKWGDVNFAAQGYMVELVNSRFAIKQGLGAAGLTDIQRGNLLSNLKTADLQILNMSRYMPQILAATTPGGRENTIGQTPVVNLNLSGDLGQFIRVEIRNELKSLTGPVKNAMSTSVKQ